MNSLRRWVDPTSFRAALVLALVATVANAVWVLLDHTAPSWDQASYLDATWHYQQALSDGGIGGLLDSIQSVDPKRGPLFSVALLPFFYVLGDVARSGLVLNLILAPVLYLAAGEIAMHIFRDWRARLLTILFVATMPLLVGLLHNTLQDFLLTTLATVSLLILLKTRLFSRPWMSIALGVAAGLGTLTKVTFPVFLVGPMLVVLARLAIAVWADRKRAGRRNEIDLHQVGISLGGAAAAYCALILPWYATNLTPTIEYVESTTSGPLSEGVGPSNPFTFDAIFSFSMEVANFHISWVIGIAGLIALCLNWRGIVSLVSPSVRIDPLTSIAFLLAWVLVPYLTLALGHNQDVRLMAPAMPGFAIVAAGAIAAIELPRIRLALAGLAVLALIYVTANHVISLRPSFVPREVTLDLGSEQAIVLLDSRSVGYEGMPGDDYATPIFHYLESRARAPGGEAVPRSVCLLQSDPVVNYNTFRFLTDHRGAPFELRELWLGPEGLRGLTHEVAECDFALYAPPAALPPGTEDDRAALVNATTASHYMTPELLDLFERPARRFPVSRSAISRDLFEDFNGISSDWMQVLVRRRASG